MSAKTVDLREAQANLKDLLSLVAQGTEIVVTDGTIPVARLVPVKSCSTARTAGLHTGAIWSSEDFDDPLPDTFWADPVFQRFDEEAFQARCPHVLSRPG